MEDSDDEDDESYDPEEDHDDMSCTTMDSDHECLSISEVAAEAQLLHQDLEEVYGFRTTQTATIDLEELGSPDGNEQDDIDLMADSIPSEEDLDADYTYSSDDSC